MKAAAYVLEKKFKIELRSFRSGEKIKTGIVTKQNLFICTFTANLYKDLIHRDSFQRRTSVQGSLQSSKRINQRSGESKINQSGKSVKIQMSKAQRNSLAESAKHNKVNWGGKQVWKGARKTGTNTKEVKLIKSQVAGIWGVLMVTMFAAGRQSQE